MRRSYVFLLVIATAAGLFVNGEAAGGQDSKEVERSLRSRDIAKVDEEERKFNAAKFDLMLDDATYRNQKFYRWFFKRRYSQEDIYNKLQVESHPIYRIIFYKYQDYHEFFTWRLAALARKQQGL
ncbi:putative secreted RxLR effector protein [Phytophthora cinnamomi]|uniref:putative secreted RxLR effector protein n=1 Tax=Phytophthora cinnamomi TaxID=4785 RepID=UPI002A2D621F|nr:putative secreted RxLR effector protein [Phytophthora cinnamomi]KAJ8571465.1 hypothetical protein ON010_g5372 [Phytophthora cinnamomi]